MKTTEGVDARVLAFTKAHFYGSSRDRVRNTALVRGASRNPSAALDAFATNDVVLPRRRTNRKRSHERRR